MFLLQDKERIIIVDEELYQRDLVDSDIILNVEETCSEILFRFHCKHIEDFEKYFEPRTYGANISPFSSKNLPKTKYVIPDEDLSDYKKVIKNLTQNTMVFLSNMPTKFLQEISNKKISYESYKADMRLKGLKGKEYIHSIGKWEEYLKYLDKAIKEIIERNNE